MLTRARVLSLFQTLQRANPEPKSELNYSSHFELLVAVILSAQSTDTGVNRATPGLFAVANTPKAMVRLGEEGLKPYISSIGLYNNKARHIIRTSEMLIRDFGGEVPSERKLLEKLPGVGRKTANVVLNIAFHQPTMAVDTHIFRVANRTGLAAGKSPLEVEKGLLKVVPEEFMQHAHHWLILHGRYICMARKPKCSLCPIASECRWAGKTTV